MSTEFRKLLIKVVVVVFLSKYKIQNLAIFYLNFWKFLPKKSMFWAKIFKKPNKKYFCLKERTDDKRTSNQTNIPWEIIGTDKIEVCCFLNLWKKYPKLRIWWKADLEISQKISHKFALKRAKKSRFWDFSKKVNVQILGPNNRIGPWKWYIRTRLSLLNFSTR